MLPRLRHGHVVFGSFFGVRRFSPLCIFLWMFLAVPHCARCLEQPEENPERRKPPHFIENTSEALTHGELDFV
jgi:hypothetical protein